MVGGSGRCRVWWGSRVTYFGGAGVVGVGRSVWFGLVRWGASADWIRGIVDTRVCCLALSGLV